MLMMMIPYMLYFINILVMDESQITQCEVHTVIMNRLNYVSIGCTPCLKKWCKFIVRTSSKCPPILINFGRKTAKRL